MRKFRNAALVAAMIGTLGLTGAGVASATNGADEGGRLCLQGAEQGDSNLNVGLINLNNVPILSSLTEQSVIQQSCVNGDASGTATGAGLEGSSSAGGVLNGLLGGLGG
ncbi:MULTISPECIES: hypothetical protein [Streptomyces]|uniref:Secreted protein n=2 Tax=Streptomyces TaxID=1883 RepID=A0ABV9IJU7_9ACTN